MIAKRLRYIIAAPLFLVATLVLSFSQVQLASAATLTWTGDGDGTTFSDGDNWNTDAAPIAADILTFPAVVGTNNVTLNNDTSLVYGGIILQAVAGSGTTIYTINSITLSDGAIISQTGSGRAASIGGAVVGNGDLNIRTPSSTINPRFTVAGDLILGDASGSPRGAINAGASSVVTGNVIVNSGSSFSVSTRLAAGGYVVNGTSALRLYSEELSVTNPIVFNGNNAKLIARSHDDCNGTQFSDCGTPATYTLSGPISFNGSTDITLGANVTMNLTGTITNDGNRLDLDYEYTNSKLLIAGQPVELAERINELSGDSSTTATVGFKEIATLTGTRDLVYVYSGGLLKGTGTTVGIGTYPGGIVNPGNSPGVLRATTGFVHAGMYQAEIVNTSAYDQIIAGELQTPGQDTVMIFSTGQLEVILYEGWSIKQGDQFMIIDNRGDQPVDGIFAGLPEGQQFDLESNGVVVTFNISYVGGDGNDVVVTALTSGTDPGAPNTGALQLITANPIITAMLGIVTVGLLALLALRRRQTK